MQRNNVRRLGVTLLIVIVLGVIALQFIDKRGAATKEEVIDQYILAIQQEKPEQIVKLLPRSHQISQAELTHLIVDSGGSALATTQISAIPSESPLVDIVKLVGTYKENGKSIQFTHMLYLQKMNNRWYLILGHDQNGLPIDAPSSKIK